MEKGFPGMRHAVLLMLLVALLSASGNLSAAEVRGIRVAATETGTRVVLDLSAPVTHKAFKLDDPARVVIDVSHCSLSKLAMPEATGAIVGVRSGGSCSK
jgi:N-acetylmuramoyl-L-alanine amidase